MSGAPAGTGKRLDKVGQRFATWFTSLLSSRDLQESKAKLEEAQRVAHVGHWGMGSRDECCGLVGRNLSYLWPETAGTPWI